MDIRRVNSGTYTNVQCVSQYCLEVVYHLPCCNWCFYCGQSLLELCNSRWILSQVSATWFSHRVTSHGSDRLEPKSFEFLSCKIISEFYCSWVFSLFLVLHHRDGQNSLCSDVTWKCTCKEKLEYFAAPCFYFHATLPQYSIKLEVWLNVKIFYAIIDGPVASVTLWCRFRLLRWSRVLWNTMVYLELDALFACSYSNYDINFELTLAVCRTLGWKQHWNVEELRPWKASKGGVLPDGVCSTYRLKLFLQPFVGWRDAGPSSVT